MQAYLFGFCHTILYIVIFLLILCINYTKGFLRLFLALTHYLVILLKCFLELKLFLV